MQKDLPFFRTTPGKFLLALLAGGGGYGLLKSMYETKQRIENTDGRIPDVEKEELRIDIPDLNKKKQTKQEVLQDFNNNPAIAPLPSEKQASLLEGLVQIAGLPIGYVGAKAIHDSINMDRLQQALDATKSKYLKALEEAKMSDGKKKKTASENLPLTDAYCQQIADELNKQAEWNGDPSQYYSLRGLTDLIPGGDTLKDMAKTLMVASALGTFGLAYHNYNKKQEDEKKKRFPERVVLTD